MSCSNTVVKSESLKSEDNLGLATCRRRDDAVMNDEPAMSCGRYDDVVGFAEDPRGGRVAMDVLAVGISCFETAGKLGTRFS